MKKLIVVPFLLMNMAFAASDSSSTTTSSSSSMTTTNKELQAARNDIQKTLGQIPTFMKSVPESALPAAWEEMKNVQFSSGTVVSAKTKELIGLALAAQIPCKYCVMFHTEAAKANGATEEEIKEAVAVAANVMHWSTFENGIQYSEGDYAKEVDQISAFMKKQLTEKSVATNDTQASSTSTDTSITPISSEVSKTTETSGQSDTMAQTNSPEGDTVSTSSAATSRESITDVKSTYQDIEKTIGIVPGYIKQFPEDSVAGAWKTLKAIQYNPETELSAKEKELIALAVSAQLSCPHCTYSHTEAAKVQGASAQEINEAVAQASVTKYWSTILNGNQIDEKTFKRELAQIIKHVKTQKSKRVGMTAVTKK